MKRGCYGVRVLRCYGREIRFLPNNLTANTLTAFLSATILAICAGTASAAEIYRFLDTTTVPVTTMGINGVFKRVLNPFRTAEIFELPPQQGASTLSFSIGQQATKSGGTVRFEIELEREGKWQPIYGKDLSAAGWVDERITLPAGTPRVRLRRKLLAGTKEQAEKSAFGDPVLLPANIAKRPSVILISLDTLRADRLGLAGHKQARTPVLDAFGKSGVWYTQAYSPSAWTLPSHASLLYGLTLPTVPMRVSAPGEPPPPHVDALSVAEILRAAGYVTAGFTGGGYLAPNFGFDRGFDTYYAFPQSQTDLTTCAPQRFDGPEVFRRGTEWLRDRGRAPFFLFLHTYDVHDRCPFQLQTKGKQDQAWDTLDAAGHARLLAYYDDLIAETDTRVGVLLRELDSVGLKDNTLVIITSDHGELFNEHKQRGHGCTNTLFEEMIRVPLLMRYPKRIKPRPAERRPVSLIDVAPTILRLLDLPPAPTMTGVSLPGFGGGQDGTRPVLIACDHQVAVRQGALKLIASKKQPGPTWLFDVERDPGEMQNLFTPEQAEPLLRIAAEHWKSSSVASDSAPRDLDPETKERLRALGYNP
jgi:choline-sulfatase